MRSAAIIGASVAGMAAAKALRAGGFDGDLHLISAEDELPYDRPPLSKGYLLGSQREEEIALAPSSFFEEQRISLYRGVRAQSLQEGSATLSDGTRLQFDRALLATGCRLRRLRVPGEDLPGVLYLRTLREARAVRESLRRARDVVVVGGGFIGLEVAAAARQLGKPTLVLEALEMPLGRVLGREPSQAVTALHADRGTRIETRAEVAAFEGDAHGVRAVTLRDGRSFPCDLALVGVGVEPNDELVDGAGQGAVVDGQLRTAIDGVYAAGDVARFPYRGQRVRIEHWDLANSMGEHAARTMLGDETPFAASLFFWSDQYDVTYQYFGLADPTDTLVLRGDLSRQDFIAFYLREGELRAAFTAGRPRDALPLRRLVDRAARVDPALLGSEEQSLRRLSREL